MMEELNFDKRFCTEALNALKSYGYKGFSVEFLKRMKLPHRGGLAQLWLDIEEWLDGGDDSDCISLLEYVDDLRMWGKQRIYLFNIENSNTIEQLSDERRIKQLVGDLYNNPIYKWQVNGPTLVYVEKTFDPQTNDSLLIFKFIELREYDIQVDGGIQALEERSTNYFIVNLSKAYAELRLQQLSTNAHLNYKQEYNLFITAIRKYLGGLFNDFRPLALEKVMYAMVQRPIYKITRVTFVTGRKSIQPTSTILLIINRLFSNPRVSYVAGYWRCKQAILGKLRLYFSLFRNSNSIDIGGIVDPNRIRELLERIVNIHNGDKPSNGPVPNPLMDKLYIKLYGQPKAQAIVLTAGAIAALLIWTIMDGIGNYFLEEWIQKLLGDIPFVVPKILVEIIWILAYYGWNRTIRSFIALKHLSPIQLWKTIREAKKNKEMVMEKMNLSITSHYKSN